MSRRRTKRGGREREAARLAAECPDEIRIELVVILDIYDAVPLYHRKVAKIARSLPRTILTACGVERSTSDVARVRPSHAHRFAEPCRVCYPLEGDR